MMKNAISKRQKEELPFTNSGLREYIDLANKRMLFLKPYVKEYDKLKGNVKAANMRINLHLGKSTEDH